MLLDTQFSGSPSGRECDPQRVPSQESTPRPLLTRKLLKAFLSAAAATAVYQLANDLAFVHVALWQSQVFTIMFVALVATAAVYLSNRSEREVFGRTETRTAERQQSLDGKARLAATVEQPSKAAITDGEVHILETAIHGEATPQFVNLRVRKDGSPVKGAIRLSPITNLGGDVSGAAPTTRDISAGERAEEALRESEARLQLQVERMPIGCILWSRDFKVLSWNPAAESIFGFSAPEVLGKHPYELIVAQKDQAQLNPILNRLLRGDAAAHSVNENLTKDGRTIVCHWTNTPLERADGEVTGILSMVQDITEHKRAEEALRETEERFRSAFEDAPFGMCLTALDGRFLQANEALCRMLGYSHQELLAGSWQDLTHPDDLERSRQAAAQLRSGTRTPVELEKRYIHKNGNFVWARLTMSAVRNGSGELSYHITHIEDITERKRAEEALRASEERFRSLIENSSDAIILLDAGGKVTYAGPSTPSVLGYSEAEFRGRNIFELMHPDHLDANQKILAQILHDPHTTLRGECLYLHKQNSWRWFEFVVQNLLDDPSVQALVVNARDISERKRVMAEIQEAKEVADAANRAKSEFLANMSHEIRTPMNGVIGMTELALDTDLTPEQRSYLNTVRSCADSLLSVINDILDFSKIEAKKLEFERIPFNLRDSIQSTLKALGVRADKKNLELACRVQPDVPDTILGDPSRLRQVLVNLVGNSIKFTERGEVVIGVEKLSQTADEVVLHFSVTDTGFGIPQEKQRAIFEAFVQADASSTRRYGGTGLGLAIASQLVGMMGGKIWLESEVGKGSTFHFTAHLGATDATPEPAIRADTKVLEGLPVLVVDDKATNRRILSELLSRWGMRPTSFERGLDALASLKKAADAQEAFPVVIVAARMPELDGFTLAERIKDDSQLAGSAIMLLASAGQRGDAARCRQIGVSAYLNKPVAESELLDALLRVLGSRVGPTGWPQLVTRHTLAESRKRLRILVAEDNPVNQLLAVRLIEKQGHSPVTAATGREALEALAKQGFDLVLMDVQMPDMDGFETTRAIRQEELHSGRHIPIIAVTAHAMLGDRERCVQAGMDGYVSKPINSNELRAAIEEVVANHSPAVTDTLS
jgi:two-component system sensor histidine kinase/response regulator